MAGGSGRVSLFIHTGAFIALFDESDHYHAEAAQYYRALDALAVQQVTSVGVVGETYTWLSHRNFAAALRWLHAADQAAADHGVAVLFPDPDVDRDTRQNISRYADQELSYVDAQSLAFIQREGVDTIFAFDHHMLLSGRTVMPRAAG
ncbi:MAG: hypothetical protein M0Z54_05770 [Thermaerobacter sp.]|nr:hypothetical protein [Thermaerobacter sp.]